MDKFFGFGKLEPDKDAAEGPADLHADGVQVRPSIQIEPDSLRIMTQDDIDRIAGQEQ